MTLEAAAPASMFSTRWAIRFGCLTLACFLFVLLGFSLSQNTTLPPIMPMTGIAMAGMLLWGKRLWPAVPVALLAALAIERLPSPVPVQLIIAFSLTLGPIAGVLVIERLIGKIELPAKAEHALPIILGAVTCSVVMATCVSVPMWLHGELRGTPLWFDIANRSVRHLTGALLTLPLVLAWADSRPERWTAQRWLYLGAILFVTGTTGYLVFFEPGRPIAWAVYPPLIWAALAFRMRGVTAAVLLVTVEAFAGSAMGLGIFARMQEDPVPVMLIFVSVTTATMLVFAALAHERLSERRLRVEADEAHQATERAQADLVDAHARLRVAQEAAGASAWEYDADAGRLVRALGDLERVDFESVDFRNGQHPTGGLASLFPSAELDLLAAVVSKAVEDKAGIDLTLRGAADDGTPRWYRVLGRYDEAHDRRRLIGMSIDVTALHEAQAAAQAATDKLLSISRLSAMGAMASTLAHELNQPLTAIANYAATCRMLLSSGIPDANGMALDHLANLSDASLRAGKIIRKMRDFTISGEISRTLEDMDEIVRSAWANVHDRPISLGVALDFAEAAGGIPVAVDRLQIEQVVINLLLNAVEATAGQDERRVAVRIASEEERVRVSICDNGHGLAPGMVEHLFEPFRTTKPEGTGLGLPICRTIVEAHGGKLWAEERPEGGTEFVFTIATDAYG